MCHYHGGIMDLHWYIFSIYRNHDRLLLSLINIYQCDVFPEALCNPAWSCIYSQMLMLLNQLCSLTPMAAWALALNPKHLPGDWLEWWLLCFGAQSVPLVLFFFILQSLCCLKRPWFCVFGRRMPMIWDKKLRSNCARFHGAPFGIRWNLIF